MRLLLDTHALVWAYANDPKLSATAAGLILAQANKCAISPASYWELAIKIATGKPMLTEPFADFIQHAIFDNGFTILPIEPRHCEPLTKLTRHHNDPFDRMLIAQAMVENIPIVSVDNVFDAYPVTRLW